MMGGPWPGDFVERGRRQHADIRGTLLDEVRRLAKGRTHEAVPDNVGAPFTRANVEPMVRGLFPKAEQDVVLATLEKSVVYVTSDTIESIILSHGWDRSAWDLANLYLLSVGAELATNDDDRLIQAIRNGGQDTINDAGQQIIRRQLNVAPTLTIRPGFPVRVIVTRDLVLEPYGG